MFRQLPAALDQEDQDRLGVKLCILGILPSSDTAFANCQLLCREDLFAEVMTEREDIASRRETCHKTLQALHTAMNTLNNLPQTLLARGGESGVGNSG